MMNRACARSIPPSRTIRVRRVRIAGAPRGTRPRSAPVRAAPPCAEHEREAERREQRERARGRRAVQRTATLARRGLRVGAVAHEVDGWRRPGVRRPSALAVFATSPGVTGDATTAGAHTRAGSAGSHSVWPSELEEQAPLGLSTQTKSAGHSASVLHGVSTTTQANVPVGLHVTSLLGGVPVLGSNGGTEQASVSSQRKPSPQSASAMQGSCQRGVHCRRVLDSQAGDPGRWLPGRVARGGGGRGARGRRCRAAIEQGVLGAAHRAAAVAVTLALGGRAVGRRGGVARRAVRRVGAPDRRTPRRGELAGGSDRAVEVAALGCAPPRRARRRRAPRMTAGRTTAARRTMGLYDILDDS